MRDTFFRIYNWVHDPKKRKHRWRCRHCGSVIKDGVDVVVERRGVRGNKGSMGFHGHCWDENGGDFGVLARSESERISEEKAKKEKSVSGWFA